MMVKLTDSVSAKVRTNFEGIFYEKAEEFLDKANKAKSSRESNEELKCSILSIILSITCLESHINKLGLEKGLSLCKEVDENESKPRPISLRKKWINFSKEISGKNIYKEKEEPFKTFSKSIDWRNKAIHYDLPMAKPVLNERLGNVSEARDIFCYENAETAFQIITLMLEYWTKLDPKIEIPKWLVEKKQSDTHQKSITGGACIVANPK